MWRGVYVRCMAVISLGAGFALVLHVAYLRVRATTSTREDKRVRASSNARFTGLNQRLILVDCSERTTNEGACQRLKITCKLAVWKATEGGSGKKVAHNPAQRRKILTPLAL